MSRWTRIAMVSALALVVGASTVSAQQPQQQGRGQGQREPRGPSPMKRPADLRVPAPYDYATFQRPIPIADNVFMSELTVIEMRDLVNKYGHKTAIIANGTVESNGPYLTTGKHNHVLRVTADRIARTLGNTLVAPIVMLDAGNPEEIDYPGSIKLREETLQAVLKDMATSLKSQGFTEIFFIGDSGSNQNTLAKVATDLNAAWKGQPVLVSHIREYYNYGDVLKYQNEVLGVGELDKDLDGYHDDYYITSLIMNDSPRHVRYDERVKVGLDQINGLPLRLEEALERGSKLAQFRADVTVAAINQRRAAVATQQQAAR
jgi:creatinine amidohydrolase